MIIQSVSVIGKRDSNEDNHVIFLNSEEQDKSFLNINFFAVFDGHGGNKISKFLKDNMLNYFIRKYTSKSPFDLTKSQYESYIIQVFDHLQTKLKIQYKNIAEHIGSTALVAINYIDNAKRNNLFIANVGDSRAMICNVHNIANPLTKDHKPHVVEEKNRIHDLDGTIEFDGDDWRIGNLSLARAFGDLDTSPYVSHKPDIYKYNVQKNDKFIVLSCDGLWDVLSNQDVANFILEYLIKIEKKEINSNIDIAKLLAEHAIKEGSMDNITIIIIFLQDFQ